METARYSNDFIDRYEAIGEARGKAEGKAESLAIVLQARGLHLTDEQRGQVTACTDAEQLDAWLTRAVSATSTDDIFKD